MLNQIIKNNLNTVKKSCLVFDIECSSHYADGEEVNLHSSYDEYLSHARCKWIGFYSYKYEKYFSYEVSINAKEIMKLFAEHDILVGFNSEEFDFPIVEKNGLTPFEKKYIHVDCMQILGDRTYKNRQGYPFKGRGELMGYELPNNKLKTIAEVMGLEVQKGEIDYKIFAKNIWDEKEKIEIATYLKADVMATKCMFDVLWNYWLPFAEFLNEKSIYDLSWIKNSIASLSYKCACNVLNIEPTYSEQKAPKEKMGGAVLLPKTREETGVYLCDVGSLYPHIFTMFNLYAETENTSGWHGNEFFQVKGYYDISKKHPLTQWMEGLLKQRISLKETDPTNPLIYTIKILINANYGLARSPIFEQVHTPNCGWDCCWLGQQINTFCISMFNSFGFKVSFSDTDSFCLKPIDPKYDNRAYVLECIKQIVEIIKDNVPFPVDTFNINLEKEIDYILFPTPLQPLVDEEGNNIKQKNRIVKVRKSLKKNYLYISKKKDGSLDITIKGMPLVKSTASPLGKLIFEEVLKPEILKNKRAIFSKEFIDDAINMYLQKPEILKSFEIEYKVQPFGTYKGESCLSAQISKHYFYNQSGTIKLIKNNKFGKVGKTSKYCTIEEAIEQKLTIQDLDLEKVYNELDPFIEIKDEKFWVKEVDSPNYKFISQKEYEEATNKYQLLDNAENCGILDATS